MDNKPRFGAFSSSVDPEKLSLTVKSLLPLVIFAIKAYGGVELTQSELEAPIDVLLLIVSSGFVFWGLVRKLLVKLGWY